MSEKHPDPASKPKKAPSVPKPSASVLLLSPRNEVLLLHRVRTSSSFPSAHVFPGGNVSPFHDGAALEPSDPARHQDSEVYRLAAIRETFEESGILLARHNETGRLLELPEEDREEGRRKIHGGKVKFAAWLESKGGRADTDALIPFTRWVTPTNVPKRFTTQMYLYMLPLATNSETSAATLTSFPSASETVIPAPTHDGGVEHTAARFLPAAEWLDMARTGEVILFPPQVFLLHLVAESFGSASSLQAQRTALEDLLARAHEKDPPWAEMCMSPTLLFKRKGDGRAVLGLDKPGPELEGSGRRGDSERVVLVRFGKEGPREVEVRLRRDVLGEEREGPKEKEKL